MHFCAALPGREIRFISGFGNCHAHYDSGKLLDNGDLSCCMHSLNIQHVHIKVLTLVIYFAVQVLLLGLWPSLVKAVALYFLMKWIVEELRAHYCSVRLML